MNHRAFSLVELLIVLTLIAVISALGLQAFVRIKDDARKQVLMARIKQFDIAKQQFISEYGRLQAEQIWSNPTGYNPPAAVLGPPVLSNSEARYYYLKRYMERPQFSLVDATPQECTIATPTNVHFLYRGTISNDSNGAQIGVTDY